MIQDWFQNHWESNLHDASKQEVNILSMHLDLNSKVKNISSLMLISQHLVMNAGQGPCWKCAPGHDSIADYSIIKSYWLKSGVTDSENLKMWVWAILEGGLFILVQPIWPMHQNKHFLGIFILVHQESMISWWAEAWDRESVAWPCTRINISRKF